MHIPENYMSPATCGIFDVVIIPIWVYAIKKTKDTKTKEKMPMLGLAAAFCFIAMMFNIPLPGGTTGHAVCGTLVAILFGGWPGGIALSVAFILQSIFFGDGGILAIGANCFNIAFVLPIVGFSLYRLICGNKPSLKKELLAAGISSYVAINVAAIFTGLELGVQPLLFSENGQALYCPYPIAISVPAMLEGHLTIAGLAEAAFTVGILAFVRKVAPNFGIQDLNAASGEGNQIAPLKKSPIIPVVIILAILVIATPLGLIAQGDAWGEWSLDDLSAMVGYAPAGMDGAFEWNAFIPDYSFGEIMPEWIAYILCAVIGVCILILIFRFVSLFMKKSPKNSGANS
ncbi:MAG: cobalt transporter CbiM [Coriobacteriales bacterium]|nr:cobalt transporter CbiM [Coriobacteriales bacterium]